VAKLSSNGTDLSGGRIHSGGCVGRLRAGLLLVAAATGCVCAFVVSPRAQTREGSTPSLLVILVVDQMRFDYVERFADRWTHGMKRIVTDGAVFERALYPYLNTVTCAGHATIGTGTYPATHGVILNEWWQRSMNRSMPCTEDPRVRPVPYGGEPEPLGHSAHRLRVPTLADRLRAERPASRAVVLSMKARSAVMLAGQSGTAVAWLSDANTWATSAAYADAPVSQVQAFIADNPIERDRAIHWDRLLPARAYEMVDDGVGERPPLGWTPTFPHPLAGNIDATEDRFADLWRRSPYADQYLGRMAAALAASFQLGQRNSIDVLAVSFSALDYIGHDFGPDSHEVQDTLFRLDRTLGDLLAALDAGVGRDRYVVALSADHGVGEIPEARTEAGGDAGRVAAAAIRQVAEAAMTAAHGIGPHIAHVENTQIYLTDAARQRASADRTVLMPIINAVARMDGVLHVFPSHDLTSRRASVDPIERAAALSHHPLESGDIVVVRKPHWISSTSSAATHGSLQHYDQHVPVIFMGRAFKPGRYATPASPADLAPTLAALIGLPLPQVDGRVLSDAFH
jgi:predicted AlkP superfamily pyrophosphatase or phosphodiesterase